MTNLALVLAVLGAIGCESEKAYLFVRLDASALSDVTRATVTRMAVNAEGADKPIAVDHGLSKNVSFIYRTATSGGMIDLQITVFAGNQIIACGTGSAVPQLGHTTPLSVTLTAASTCESINQDMGAPLDGGSTCKSGVAEILCEDFESGALQWMPNADPDTSVVIDSTFAHRGTHSLRLRQDPIPGDAGAHYPEVADTHVISYSTPFWVREFVFLGPAITGTFVVLLAGGPTAGAGVVADTGVACESDYGTLEAPYSFANTCGNSIGFPRGQWVCVEWFIDPGQPDGGGRSHGFIDGNEAFDIGGIQLPHYPYLELRNGQEALPGAPAQELWVDDVAVSKNRIGCDP